MVGLLNTATAAMNVAKGQAQIAAENMARHQEPTANRHTASVLTEVVGGSVYTRLAPTKSVFSEAAHIKLRETNGDLGFYQAQEEYLSKLQSKYGSPGDENSLSDLMAGMKNALSSINTSPINNSHRRDLVFAAQNLARDVRGLSSEIQSLRAGADREISAVIIAINQQLQIISDTNKEIGMSDPQTTSIAAHVDRRLEALKELGKYVDFMIVGGKNERINVKLKDGSTLVSEVGDPATINYTPKGTMAATDAYPVGFNQIQLTFAGATIDMTPLVGAGRLKGLIEVRDTILPRRQAELDEFTTLMRDRFNAIHNKGTGHPPAQILTGTRRFADPAVDTLTFTGTLRIARVQGKTAGVNDPNGTFNNFVDIPAQAGITINAFRDLINAAAIGVTATINTDNQLVLDAGHADFGVALTSTTNPEATVTATGQGVSDYFGLNDFFTTGTYFNGDGLKIGLSDHIDVRADIVGDPTRLASYILNGDPTLVAPAAGTQAIGGGATPNALAMSQFFDTPIVYGNAGDLPGMTVTPAAYASSILDSVSTNINHTKSQVARAETAEQTLMDSEKRVSGIDPQAEMINLITANQSFTMAAKIAETAKQMMDVLMSIK